MNLAERDVVRGLAARQRKAGLFLELAPCGRECRFAGLDQAFGDRPGAEVLAGEEGTAGMHEQELELAAMAAQQQSCAGLGSSSSHGAGDSILPAVQISTAAPHLQPSRRRRRLRILGVVALLLLLGAGGLAWSMWPTVEDIPEVLPPIEDDVVLGDLELSAQGPMPALKLAELRGKQVMIVIEGKESFGGDEGKLLRRALHRWTLPDDVVALHVGDAPIGAKIMSGKIEREFVGPMREEMKLPIYVDYGGSFTSAFNLPSGHFGFVLLDEQGEVQMRLAGDATPEQVAELAELVGATEPPPGPAAPEFAIAELSTTSCADKHCVLVFLDRKVVRSDIPGLEQGGFEGEMEQAFEQIRIPSVRLARVFAADWPTDRPDIAGVIVGQAEGWEVPGWPVVADAPEAREAFGIGPAAGMVILDPQGRIAFSETGKIAFWKLSVAADLLGIEPKRFGKRHD